MPKEISEMVAVSRGLWQGASAGQSPRKGWDPFFPPGLGLVTQHSQGPLATPALSQAIPSEVLGRRPGRNGLSAVSSAQGQGLSDIGLCLFLADRPFRLGHLEISFGICANSEPLKKQPVNRTRIAQELDLKFCRRMIADVIFSALKGGDACGSKFDLPRVIRIICDEANEPLELEDPEDLEQKFLPHHPPDFVTALGPRIRKEHMNAIGAGVRQGSKDFKTVSMQHLGVPKAKPRNLSLRSLNPLALALDSEKI